MNIRLFPSFSGLLLLLKNGYEWNDGEDCIYMFGCTREGIDGTFDLYDRGDVVDRKGIMQTLDQAEAEGRVLWRKELNSRSGAAERMMWLVLHLRMMGVEVAEPADDDRDYSEAGVYLPALSRWLEASAPTVKLIDRESSKAHWHTRPA
jgi:hypothetical protein